jgi:hypothetical protein
MADSAKRTVRKGQIYHLRVADIEYRAFIWQSGSSFCGRIEDHPELPLCRGRSIVAVREQLCTMLARGPIGESLAGPQARGEGV